MRVKSIDDLPLALREQIKSQQTSTAPARSKYGSHVVELEGEIFDSKWELRRWQELQQMLAAGLITDLRRQVPFPLHVISPNGARIRIASYEADFTYRSGGQLVIEDAKSEATRKKELYRHKAKHFEAEYQLCIVEVMRQPRRKKKAPV